MSPTDPLNVLVWLVVIVTVIGGFGMGLFLACGVVVDWLLRGGAEDLNDVESSSWT